MTANSTALTRQFHPLHNHRLLILIEDRLYEPLRHELCCYIIEGGYQGVNISIQTLSPSTAPETIRRLLQEEYEQGLDGCLLIGNLTAPIYGMAVEGSYDLFPIDLYFMDLDGFFSDTNDDGVLDSHWGEREPDIFLGRLYPSTLYSFGNSTSLLKTYFARNSLYRRGILQVPQRVLTFIDDDWSYLAPTWHTQATQLYPTGKLVNAPLETTASAYLDELEYGYEFVLVGAHSNPQRHYFYQGQNPTIITSQEIYNLQPSILFANLFACSVADYRFGNYLAGAYLFADMGPLALIATSKPGSMYDFELFYAELAEGKGVGVALQSWLETAIYPQIEWPESPGWSYGLTCLGDPILPVALNHTDIDEDGLPTFWEQQFGFDPNQPEANDDPDEDGLSNSVEFTLFSNPINSDTDQDGLPDGWEHQYGLDVFFDDSQDDVDEDELTNREEYLLGTNPLKRDTDEDGLSDSVELTMGTCPTNPDTDWDGISDSQDLMPTLHWAIIVIPLAILIGIAIFLVRIYIRRKR